MCPAGSGQDSDRHDVRGNVEAEPRVRCARNNACRGGLRATSDKVMQDELRRVKS